MAGEKALKDWEDVAVALGTRVRLERERLQLTKEALSETSGLASRYIWRVEAGKQNLQLGNISKIAKGLGMRLSELVDGIEELIDDPIPKPPTRPRGPAAKRAKN